MSSYLHIFPANDVSIQPYLKEQGVRLEDIPVGRAITESEFHEVIGGVQSSDYQFKEDGRVNIRKGNDDTTYAILSGIAKKCGSQIILNDDMDVLVFTSSTTIEDFISSGIN